MSLILNIDTSTELAYINIAENGHSLGEAFNTDMKDHAGFLQTAIQKLSEKTGIKLNQLDAVSVTSGPGSYTGLRVGMASAKGLCYALNIPLITIGTLDAMAEWAITQLKLTNELAGTYICPMIDARRMEVFTAVYTHSFEPVLPPEAMILTEHSFETYLAGNSILFFGNGASKWQEICVNSNAVFKSLDINHLYMSGLSFRKFQASDFANLAYCEPDYLKEFFTTIKLN